MPEQIKLEISTPERRVVSEMIDEIVLPSVEGYMGVLPGHAPLLARLEPGKIAYRQQGKDHSLAVSGGYAEVLRDGVQILADSCERPEEIDLERAKSAQERAEKRMGGDLSNVDLRRAEMSLKRAVSRIEVQALLHR